MTKEIRRAIILFLISMPVVIAGAILKILALPMSAVLLVAGLILQAGAVVYFLYLLFSGKLNKDKAQ